MIKNFSETSLDNYSRLQMVILIEQLHELKKYKVETLYTAVSIADRYLINQAVTNNPTPDAVVLAVTAVMLAGKLEQEESPSFNVLS